MLNTDRQDSAYTNYSLGVHKKCEKTLHLRAYFSRKIQKENMTSLKLQAKIIRNMACVCRQNIHCVYKDIAVIKDIGYRTYQAHACLNLCGGYFKHLPT